MPGTCVYCGNKPGSTRDHVPPKSLFPKPRPVNMLTVPCCNDCQARFKKDEDVFMAWITIGPAVQSRASKPLWYKKVKRTFEKDRGVNEVIRRSCKLVDLQTPAGVYIGKGLASSIDHERKNNVLRKIVRGLFWVEYKERLPEEVPIEIYGINGTGSPIEELIPKTRQATTFWEGIFEYRHARVPECLESYWILSFFRRNYFFAAVNGSDLSEEIKKLHNEQMHRTAASRL
jgi:hypothetical protein